MHVTTLIVIYTLVAIILFVAMSSSVFIATQL